jgi:hypothetical protein
VRERDRARAALELVGVAVVVSDVGALDLECNAAARRLRAEIVEARGRCWNCSHALPARSGTPAGMSRILRRSGLVGARAAA